MAKRKSSKPVVLDDDKLPRPVNRSAFRSHGQKRKEWEPSAYQLAIYEAVRKGSSYRAVAAAFSETGKSISFQRVGAICQAVDQYLAQYYMENIRELRARHTGHLEHIFCEAMAAFEKSKGIGVTEEFESVSIENPENSDGEPIGAIKTKRKEVHQCGNPAFLGEARAALADIRKIHAVDKNPKMVETDEGDEDRVAGKSRETVIEEHILRLQAAKKALQVTKHDQVG